MEVRSEDREGLFKAMTVELKGEQVKEAVEEVCRDLQAKVELQGFRKGSAPLWLIRAKYKDYIQEEVGKKLANETLDSAIKESDLKPVADIYLEKVELNEKESSLRYTVSFEVPPSFELQELEGIEVEVPKIEFSEEFFERKVNQLREEHAVWEPVEDREVREGDLVTIQYEVVEIKEGEEGEKVSGETSGVIGQRMFREELEEALKGKRLGDEVSLSDLPLYDQEGKEVGKANIKAKIEGIKEKVLPEPGDDFAKELGYESWEEAEKNIREEVKKDFERTKKAIVEDSVAEKIVSMHEFEVPKTLLSREISFLIDRRVKDLQNLGIDPKYLDYRSMAQEFMPQAVANIKLRYILDRYAEEKGIEAEEEDIEEQYRQLAQQMGTSVEEVKDYFKRENMEEVVRTDARRKKALKEIIDKAQLKEVEPEQEEGGKENE